MFSGASWMDGAEWTAGCRVRADSLRGSGGPQSPPCGWAVLGVRAPELTSLLLEEHGWFGSRLPRSPLHPVGGGGLLWGRVAPPQTVINPHVFRPTSLVCVLLLLEIPEELNCKLPTRAPLLGVRTHCNPPSHCPWVSHSPQPLTDCPHVWPSCFSANASLSCQGAWPGETDTT